MNSLQRKNQLNYFWSNYYIMILVYFTVGSTSSGSAFVIAPNLGTKILSEYFTGAAPPILCSWSYSQIGCSTPLYSRSVSLIGSAYLFLYISFCFGFNKLLTNLTSLCQHLQYRMHLAVKNLINLPTGFMTMSLTSSFQANSSSLFKTQDTTRWAA